jgi:hypothetical protein
VFPTHVHFYLDGRKNDMYGGNFLDVAAPTEHNESGVYSAGNKFVDYK